MKFVVAKTKGDDYTWRLYSSSDKVAWAGESFASKSNAERACRAFKTGAGSARYDIYADSGGNWRWRAWRSSDRVASSGESFASKSNAQRAANNVRDNASSADGP